MADTIESLKKQINDLKREYQNLTGKPAALFEVKNIEDAEKAIRTLNGSLKNAYHEAEKLEKGFGGVYSEIQSILGELNKSENAANKVTKAFKGVERIARDLKDDQQGYNKLSIKELETRQKKLKSAQAETNLQASRLKEEKKSLLLGEDGNVLRGSDLRQRLQSLQIAGDITEEEQSILNGQEEGFSVLRKN
jgi:archaellum component FlaC